MSVLFYYRLVTTRTEQALNRSCLHVTTKHWLHCIADRDCASLYSVVRKKPPLPSVLYRQKPWRSSCAVSVANFNSRSPQYLTSQHRSVNTLLNRRAFLQPSILLSLLSSRTSCINNLSICYHQKSAFLLHF